MADGLGVPDQLDPLSRSYQPVASYGSFGAAPLIIPGQTLPFSQPSAGLPVAVGVSTVGGNRTVVFSLGAGVTIAPPPALTSPAMNQPDASLGVFAGVLAPPATGPVTISDPGGGPLSLGRSL
jgi:hypothetical protein